MQQDTGEETPQRLCKSTTLEASQMKSIKPHAKPAPPAIGQETLVWCLLPCKFFTFTTVCKSDLQQAVHNIAGDLSGHFSLPWIMQQIKTNKKKESSNNP